jgi:hypothetical protein
LRVFGEDGDLLPSDLEASSSSSDDIPWEAARPKLTMIKRIVTAKPV